MECGALSAKVKDYIPAIAEAIYETNPKSFCTY